jgi:hypothetical protein
MLAAAALVGAVTAFVSIATVALAAVAAAGVAGAQSPDGPDTALAARLEAVARLRVGRQMRVRLDNGAKLGGRFAGAQGDVFGVRLPPPARLPPGAVAPDTTPYELAVSEVDSLWERRTYGPAAPFLLAAAGAVAGYLVVWVEWSSDDGDCDSQCSQAALDGGVVGAVLGLAAGIAVGFLVPIWQQHFP